MAARIRGAREPDPRAAPTIVSRSPRPVPPEPRVLFVGAPEQDYLTDAVVHGLRLLLGDDAVEYPERDRLYAYMPPATATDPRARLHALRAARGTPVDRSGYSTGAAGRVRPRRLRRHLAGFGMCIRALAPRAAACRSRCSTARTRRAVPVRAGCGGAAVLVAAAAAAPPRHYFKREITPWTPLVPFVPRCRRRVRAPAGCCADIRPIAFAIPEEKIVAAPAPKDREFAAHVVDPEVAAALGAQTSYAFDEQAAYYDDLRRVALRRSPSSAPAGTRCATTRSPRTAPCRASATSTASPRCARRTASTRRTASSTATPTTCCGRSKQISGGAYEQLQRGALAWAARNTTRVRARALLAAFS